jgi:hypothetical protein
MPERRHLPVSFYVPLSKRTHDPPDYPDRFVARLVTAAASPYILVADTLAEVRAALPHGLKRSARQPADLPDVVEVWFAE